MKRNQYGGTVGGPILADRLFYFAGYQGTNTGSCRCDNRAFVPTAQMLAGDFTAFASPACNNGRQITLAAPFAGNQIDPKAVQPGGLAYYLEAAEDQRSVRARAVHAPDQQRRIAGVGKIDYQWSSNNRCSAATSRRRFFQLPPCETRSNNVLTTSHGGTRQPGAVVHGRPQLGASRDALVNSFRVAFNRTAIHRTNADFFGANDVGVNIYTYMPKFLVLNVTPGGFSIGGGTENDARFRTNTYQVERRPDAGPRGPPVR